jgi:predicted DNA-binding helix-hairpin-helix protein
MCVLFASKEEFLRIPGITFRTADSIITIRNSGENITLGVQDMLERTFDEEEVALLDFSTS